jgi:hypothetical protein
MRRSLLVIVAVLALSACWQQAGFDAGNSRFSSLATGVDTSNVAKLTHAFTYPVNGANALVVSDGKAFVGADRVYAFDAAGSSGCTGTPAVCAPLWTSSTPAGGSLVIGGGRLWATGNNAVLAFDPAGKSGCSGSPLVCTPLVSIPVDGPNSLRWANDALHVTSVGGPPSFTVSHRVYRADGALLWSAGLGSGFPTSTYDSVIDGNVVIAGIGGFSHPVAFDARGVTGCSGSPAVCTPLWTYDADGNDLAARAGRFYATHDGRLAAYDSHGSANCFGAPKVCYPIWTSVGPAGRTVVTDDRAFVGYGGTISAYALDANHCTGAIPSCTAERFYNSIVGAFDLGADAVAGGVLFATRKECSSVDCSAGTVTWQLDAYDAAGTGCASTPCRALWSADTPTQTDEVEIVGDVVYALPHVGNGQPAASIRGYRPSS